MNIYHKTINGENGLSVAINSNGVSAKEVCSVVGLIDNPPSDLLVTEGYWTWEEYRKRDRCYGGDDGSGRIKERIVAGAISLLGYWGGSESWIDDIADFEEID